MRTTFDTVNLPHPAWAERVLALYHRCRDALERRRQRAQLRARLSDLGDRDLHDIGLARGEIDFAAASAAEGVDPRHRGPSA